MRRWSVHPKYLDTKGLLAVWREGLLAQKVLAGSTRGYRNHPQLRRFREYGLPLYGISRYLGGIYLQARARGYSFDKSRIISGGRACRRKMRVTSGQLVFEFRHLLAKLKKRDPQRYRKLSGIKKISAHPFFRVVPGGSEDWERGVKSPRGVLRP